MMDKITALQALQSLDGHDIVSAGYANSIGESFGISFAKSEFKRDPDDWKSVNRDCAGVESLTISAAICRALGIEQANYGGRGTQYRDDIEKITDALNHDR